MTTAAQTTPRHRLRAVLAAAALGSMLLSGCARFSPVQTDFAYQAADGVSATFGDLDVRGLAIIADAKDAPGVVTGQLVNTSDEDIDVTISTAGSAPAQVTVPRHSSLPLESEDVTLTSVAAAPGAVIDVNITMASTGQNVLITPVLPSVSYYTGITPAPAASPSTSG